MDTPTPDVMDTEDIHKYILKSISNTDLETLTVSNYMEWLDALTDCFTMAESGLLIDATNPPSDMKTLCQVKYMAAVWYPIRTSITEALRTELPLGILVDTPVIKLRHLR